MKIKSDGKRMLRFWLGLSELLIWLLVFQLLKYLGTIGVILCLGALALKWYEIAAEKRDVYHKYKRHNKATISVMVCITITALALHISSALSCFYTLMLFFGYYLTRTYALNIYDWVVRWGDLADTDSSQIPYVYVQLDNTPEMLEAANRKFLGTRFIPAMLGIGVLCYGVWISPVFNWIRGFLVAVFLRITLVIAEMILSIFPEMQETEPLKAGNTNGTTEFNSIVEMRKAAAANHFGSSYQIAAIILLLVMVGALAFYAYKVWKRSGATALRGNYKTGQGNKGLMQSLRAVTAEVLSHKAPRKSKGAPEAVLRRKYIQLLKQLEQQGWAIEKADTSEQIKLKLSQLYPNQETIIDVITEAYCERRYAEREPENIDMVLQAFNTLERIKKTDSPIKGGVS